MVSCVELLVAQWVQRNRHNNSFKRNKENQCDLPEHGKPAVWIFHRSSVSSLDDCHLLSCEFSAWRNHFDSCGFTYQFNKRKRALLWQRRVERLDSDIRRRSIWLRSLHGSTTSIYLLGACFFSTVVDYIMYALVFTSTKCVALQPVDNVTFPGIYAHMSVAQTDTHTNDYHLHNVRVAHIRNKKKLAPPPPQSPEVHCSYKSHHDILKFSFFLCFLSE